MARRPLWIASLVLASAWFALPSAAVDVNAPTDLGPATVSGSGAGASVTGANSGVSVVPSLSPGLGSPLAAPIMAAPVAAPSALAASPLAAAAPAHAAPAGAAIAARGAASSAGAKASPANAENAFYSPKAGPGGIAQKVVTGHGVSHALDHDAAWDDAAKTGAFAGKMSGAQLKAMFDGAKPGAELPEHDFTSARPFKPGVPALAPLSKSAPAAGPEVSGPAPVEAPVPPREHPVDALANKLDAKLSGFWQKIKQGFGAKPPPADVAPTVTAERPLPRDRGDELESPDGILVHAPRALRFDALGYRVHFAPPDGAPFEEVPDEAVRVRVERGAGDAGTQALRERFDAFNTLIEANFAALEMIAQSSSKMTVKTGRLVLAKVEEMAAAYAKMVGPGEAVDETAEVASLGIGFDSAVKGLNDGDLLPPHAAALVMPLESASLHYEINKLHQAALREVGRADVKSPANLVVKLGKGAGTRAVSLVDLSEHPLVKGGRLVSPAFKALVEAMTRSKDQPKGSLILQDHQFWGHFKLGAHSAEVYANFLPPDEGGMIRVRYQEWGTGYDNQTRLYYVARLLQKAGFHVEQDSGFLTAVVDKDHAAQSVDEMTDTFALVVQALHATVGVDFALPILVQGAKTSAEVGERIDQWVDVVLGEGTLPFYRHDNANAMVTGWNEYRAKSAARAELRAGLDRTLARLGLPAIPASDVLGQRTVDRFFNEPIAAALARGELRLTKKGTLEKVPRYDPLAELSAALERDAVPAARMAEAVSSLDPGLLRFETVGSLGALNVERAERRLEPGDWLTVYVLRDPRSGQIGFAEATLAGLRPGESPRRLEPAELFRRLAEQGYPVAPFAPAPVPAGLDYFEGLLKSEPVVDRSLGRRAQGLAASPGHGRPVLARATYDPAKAAKGGMIFVAPYTTPDDLDAIRASKAVLTTSGGLLSHAAITTREMGIPAAILSRATWNRGAAVFESPEFGGAYRLDGLAARRRRAGASGGARLSEGALVRLDPASGAIEIFDEGVGAPLLDAERALEAYDRDGDGKALVAWARARLAPGSSLLPLQKAALAQSALEGLGARALTRPEAAADLAAFYKTLPRGEDKLAVWAEDSAASFFDEARRGTLELLSEKRGAVGAAMSVEAVERALRAGEARAARFGAVARALGRPKQATLGADLELGSLRSEAQRRVAALLTVDFIELSKHARLFPNATVEVLPRLKAAIAKARRRGFNPELVAGWERRVLTLERTREDSLRAQAPAVMPLRKVLDMDVPRVGGKAAKLGEISAVVARAGGEVPPGLALTVAAYRRFLRQGGIAEKLERVASYPELSPDERAARARRLILDAPLTAKDGVGKEIVDALNAEGLQGAMLAVRSSAVDEDGADAAFAGAGDTHLYVKPADLLPHVKEIWASLWNPRALLYRETKGLATTNLAQAVVVQAMADSEVSGVAFTQDPVSGDSSRLVVNAAFGLGEGVVSGRVAPDQYVVGKALGREVLPAMVADKKLAIVRGRNGVGTEERKMPPEWRRRRAMTPAKLEKLNAVALALESHFGYALDIEFGFVGDKLYILQARPVTGALPEEPAVPAPPAAAPSAPKAAEHAPRLESKRLMFVCAGNTCRSPMAERLAKQKLREEGRSDFEVLSRGLDVAQAGAPMSSAAQAAVRNYGGSGDGHAALGLADSDVVWADVILTMTGAQAAELLRRYPSAKGKVFTLGQYSGVGGDVADPYGGDDARYRASAAQIAAGVDAALDRAELASDAAVPAR